MALPEAEPIILPMTRRAIKARMAPAAILVMSTGRLDWLPALGFAGRVDCEIWLR